MTRSAQDNAGGTDLPGAHQVESTLAGVFERAEFVRQEPNLLTRTLDRVRTAVLDLLASIFENLGVPEGWAAGLGQFLTILFIALGVLLVGLILWRIVRRARGDRWREPRPGKTRADAAMGVEGWRARAAEAAGRGAYREAAVALYRSVILTLGDAGVVRVREGRTPGEYAREARGNRPALGPAFRSFLGVFHPVAFGPRSPDGAAFADLQVAAERVVGALGPTDREGGTSDG
jgi:hypothetical protein